MKKTVVYENVHQICGHCDFEELEYISCDKCNNGFSGEQDIYCCDETGDHYCIDCGKRTIEEEKKENET